MNLPPEAIQAGITALRDHGTFTTYGDENDCVCGKPIPHTALRPAVTVWREHQMSTILQAALPHLVPTREQIEGIVLEIALTTTLTGEDVQTCATTIERILRPLPTREQVAQAIWGRRDDPYDDYEWDELTSADRELWECYADAVLDLLNGDRP